MRERGRGKEGERKWKERVNGMVENVKYTSSPYSLK